MGHVFVTFSPPFDSFHMQPAGLQVVLRSVLILLFKRALILKDVGSLEAIRFNTFSWQYRTTGDMEPKQGSDSFRTDSLPLTNNLFQNYQENQENQENLT